MNRSFLLVEQAIQMMHQGMTSPQAIAEALHITPNHLQKTFSDWAGLPMGQYAQMLSKSRLRQVLAEGENVLQGALDMGLSGTGRLHDLSVKLQAATPGEIRSGGSGLTIQHGRGETPFGPAWLAWSDRGICELHFLECPAQPAEPIRTESPAERLTELQTLWPLAKLSENPEQAQKLLNQAFVSKAPDNGPLRLHVKGTAFQIKVWEALIRIPEGRLISYGQLAKAIGNPKASRAAGTAVASNRLACLIPCHRVIQAAGDIGQYRWGEIRKHSLLLKELSKPG